jgi:hypothetical protein
MSSPAPPHTPPRHSSPTRKRTRGAYQQDATAPSSAASAAPASGASSASAVSVPKAVGTQAIGKEMLVPLARIATMLRILVRTPNFAGDNRARVVAAGGESHWDALQSASGPPDFRTREPLIVRLNSSVEHSVKLAA